MGLLSAFFLDGNIIMKLFSAKGRNGRSDAFRRRAMIGHEGGDVALITKAQVAKITMSAQEV